MVLLVTNSQLSGLHSLLHSHLRPGDSLITEIEALMVLETGKSKIKVSTGFESDKDSSVPQDGMSTASSSLKE